MNSWCRSKRREVVQEVSNIDKLLLEHRRWHQGVLQMCRLDENSAVVDDMVCKNAPSLMTDWEDTKVHGSISRQDVLDSIVWDKVTFLQIKRMDALWPQQAMHLKTLEELYFGIQKVATMFIPFPSLLAKMASCKHLESLAENMAILNDVRGQLVLYILGGSSTSKICHMALCCVDLCLEHNIDALCGTPGHMHDVCLVHKQIMATQSDTQEVAWCKTISALAMQNRTQFSNQHHFGITLRRFRPPQTSICRAIWKRQVVASLENHWENGVVGSNGRIDIAKVGYGTLFPYKNEYLFVPESHSHFIFGIASEDMYEEDQLRAMLRTILFAMTASNVLNIQQANLFWNCQTDGADRNYIHRNWTSMESIFQTHYLMYLLMTVTPHSPETTLHQIEELWTSMCGE